MSESNEPQAKETVLVSNYGNSYMEDALDVEFLLTDLAVELAKAKEQGYDRAMIR
jgi:hypothetical protein